MLRVYQDSIIAYRKDKNESFSDIDKKFGLSEGETQKLNSGKETNGIVYVKAEENKMKLYLIQQQESQKLEILRQ